MADTMPLITAKSSTRMLVCWEPTPSSLCYLLNSLGFCLSFTLVDLKVWIFLYYPTTGASLMCTAHLRTIRQNNQNIHVLLNTYDAHDLFYYITYISALLVTLEFQQSAKRKGHFALYNCLVLGHTKYNGVQRVYCNPFPAKHFYSCHRLDMVMIRPPCIDNAGFVVSPDTVRYAQVLLLFSASAMTDTGSKSFACALVSTLETYDDPENGNYIN